MAMIRRRTLWLAALTVLLLAVGALCYMMYMPHRDISHEIPVELTSTELADAYMADETAANQRFLDKAVQVTGVVEGIETNNDGQTVISLAGNYPLTGVRCTLQKSVPVETGKTVVVKGRCTGFLTDVVLVDCIFIKSF